MHGNIASQPGGGGERMLGWKRKGRGGAWGCL